MTRLEAWNFMKKLSDGYATLIVRQKLDASGRPRDMIQSMSTGALSDSGNKSDSSMSDNSENDNGSQSAATTTSTTSGKPSSADLASETSLEATKVEAKR